MKNKIFIVLLSAAVGMTFFCGGPAKKKEEKSYTQQLVGAMAKTDALMITTKIKTIKAALDLYYTDNNEYPEMLDELVPSYLRTKVELLDPWDTPFELETDEEMNLVIISAGKDKTFGNDDDIKRSI